VPSGAALKARHGSPFPSNGPCRRISAATAECKRRQQFTSYQGTPAVFHGPPDLDLDSLGSDHIGPGSILLSAVGPQPSGADQAAVTLGNADGEIGGITMSDPPNQAEVQALRDKCEELADDVRGLSTLVHALRGALVAVGVVKGGV